MAVDILFKKFVLVRVFLMIVVFMLEVLKSFTFGVRNLLVAEFFSGRAAGKAIVEFE